MGEPSRNGNGRHPELRARARAALAEDADASALYLIEGLCMIGAAVKFRMTADVMGWQFVRGAEAAEGVAAILRRLGWVRVRCVRWG